MVVTSFHVAFLVYLLTHHPTAFDGEISARSWNMTGEIIRIPGATCHRVLDLVKDMAECGVDFFQVKFRPPELGPEGSCLAVPPYKVVPRPGDHIPVDPLFIGFWGLSILQPQ